MKRLLSTAVAAGVLVLAGCGEEEPPEELEPIDDAERTHSEGASTPGHEETEGD